MLMLAVLVIFAAMIAAMMWAATRQANQPKPIPVRRDDLLRHRHRRLPPRYDD